ncbi:hypothetical protein E3U44_18300 [Nitrosococcus wardiae]|uniref:SF3 helicase domain-containing protein n=2 Tax=Nitrosococcus wardiae TaxID=1814290 RepID=A0A4P7C5T1_9GAMM|nr:hypothetical protein E3U44_18300 [Nitrosococcus wardiae]
MKARLWQRPRIGCWNSSMRGQSRRYQGMDLEEAKLLVLHKAGDCKPPLPEDEALRCLDSAYGRYSSTPQRPLTELGNAERLVDRFGEEIRYVPAYHHWLLWNGTHWQMSEKGEIERLAHAVVRGIKVEADAETDDARKESLIKHGRNSERKTAISNMLSLTATLEGIALAPHQLDADPYAFGVENGVVNLRMGQLRPPNPADYLTKYGHVVFQPEAQCPRWEHFVLEVMGEDKELVSFLQRAVGTTLVAGNPDQVLLILHGQGANGKSTLLRIIQTLMGSYARAAENALFTVNRFQNQGGPREDIVRLKDARMVLTTELGEGEILNEDLVKRMTGDDTLTGRVPYGKASIEFRPQFTPWMATNHKPIIRGDDHAIWRRVKLIPFEQTFAGKKQDKGLSHALLQELPGILNWAIQGCLDWQKEGLNSPQVVEEATREYRSEMDLLGEWLEERCVQGAEHKAKTADLYQDYLD